MMQSERSRPGKKIVGWLQAGMSVIYGFSGFYLLSSDNASLFLPEDLSPWIPLALIMYGAFRAHRAWMQLRNSGITSA
jgi:hypothetical protein